MTNDGRIIPHRDLQEDTYFQTRALAEEVLGIKIDADQWNKFFGEAISPYLREISILTRERDTIVNALRGVKDAFAALDKADPKT